ncbi:MAG: prepilin-type N-terminal cleavage/methylation domain-containing protein [Legionellaceae bacterium]|nr:prepilin-type N-terminal cleavage/methylation domain-containing protein [Legionellaceae bacterium]
MCRKIAGFSLTELLVSFFISTLLILILTQHLLSVSRQHHHVHAVLDQAMELQWVLDVMRDRVHHAGFTPCRRLDHLLSTDTREYPESLLPIEINQDDPTKLYLRKMSEAAFTQAMIKTSTELFIKKSDKFMSLSPERPILIADCTHAEVHDVESMAPVRGGHLVTLKKPLVFDYEPEVYVGEWLSESFYFKKALFYKQHRADKLTSQIKRIKFELNHHTTYPILSMQFVLHDGTSDSFETRVRMP